MNQAVIRKALVEKGMRAGLIEFGWLGTAGPGIHIDFTGIYALLPLDDGLDLKFADFIYNEWSRYYGPEKRADEGTVEGIEA